MVLLRSGKSYIHIKNLNDIISRMNKLIFYITDIANVKDILSYMQKLTITKSNIYIDFIDIIKNNNIVVIHHGPCGGKYFVLDGKKKYIGQNHNLRNNLNYNLRNRKQEELAIAISKFLINYTKLIKNCNKISNKYVPQCAICYTTIVVSDRIVACINANNVIHPYHTKCFNINLHHIQVPYIIKTSETTEISETSENIKYYECPYCRKKNIDIKDIYLVQ